MSNYIITIMTNGISTDIRVSALSEIAAEMQVVRLHPQAWVLSSRLA